ncbi:MAG: FHA domain-containing protein [Anaerolineae bacterium]|nr:FHA domain-containing protein [Anaerolineae bacterium]
MPNTTLSTQERPVVCLHCGYYCRSDDTRCRQCGAPLSQPSNHRTTWLDYDAQPAPSQGKHPTTTSSLASAHLDLFLPQASAIFQFRPSGLVISSQLDKPLILGRGYSETVKNLLDLSGIGAADLGVSRVHCTLRRYGKQLLIVDMGSSNGTFINGERIAAHHDRVVAHGNDIRIGELTFTIFFTVTQLSTSQLLS